ncbi:MAG: hypothetical protein MUE85_01560 [Microscillaceae bacterium]|nr:hypothetical protein [Microscillaceae bacterium]
MIKNIRAIVDIFYYQQKYRNSLTSSPVADEVPWITFRALDFLQKIIRSDMHVFEYGMGGSTLFLAPRVQKLISIEHDIEWYNQIKDQLRAKNFHHVDTQLFVPPKLASNVVKNPQNPHDYAAYYISEWRGFSFENYAQAIENYPDNSFDLILIDGRARNACAMHAHTKLKLGGYLLLDNAERPNYAYIHQLMNRKSYQAYHFWGIGGYAAKPQRFWQTSLWQRID